MKMAYIDFLNVVIERGLESAKADYQRPEDRNKLEGSIEGFEACRSKEPKALLDLLAKAQQDTLKAFHDNIETWNYWKIRCREAEIEWVCNVVSAALANIGLHPITNPTARSCMMAASILAGSSLLVWDEIPA